jgi:excisionase family DNA binding protein
MEKKPLNLLTVNEAASILEVSTRTIYTYFEAKKLKPVKDGRRVFIEAQEVENLKEASRIPSYDPAKHVILDRSEYEAILQRLPDHENQLVLDRKSHEELLQKHEGLLVRLGQLEAEKRFLEGHIKLIEDKRPRPWWRRIFSK